MWKVLANVGCLRAAGARMLSLGQQHNKVRNFPIWAGRMELTGNHFEKTVCPKGFLPSWTSAKRNWDIHHRIWKLKRVHYWAASIGAGWKLEGCSGGSSEEAMSAPRRERIGDGNLPYPEGSRATLYPDQFRDFFRD